jgi:CspA family cold shock protein
MAIGTVKWFSAEKGFGFITPDGGGKDVFVDISAVERAGMADLGGGQMIKYNVAMDHGKPALGQLPSFDARHAMRLALPAPPMADPSKIAVVAIMVIPREILLRRFGRLFQKSRPKNDEVPRVFTAMLAIANPGLWVARSASCASCSYPSAILNSAAFVSGQSA